MPNQHPKPPKRKPSRRLFVPKKKPKKSDTIDQNARVTAEGEEAAGALSTASSSSFWEESCMPEPSSSQIEVPVHQIATNNMIEEEMACNITEKNPPEQAQNLDATYEEPQTAQFQDNCNETLPTNLSEQQMACNITDRNFAETDTNLDLTGEAGLFDEGNAMFAPAVDIIVEQEADTPADETLEFFSSGQSRSTHDVPASDFSADQNVNVPTPAVVCTSPPPHVLIDADDPPSDIVGLLSYVQGRLNQLLPPNWFALSCSQGIQVGFRLATELLVVQRSAFFCIDGRIVGGLHGKSLPDTHALWDGIHHPSLTRNTAKEFIDNVVTTVGKLRSFEVCRGVEDYRHLWKTVDDVEIDKNIFQETRYKETCRSKECHLLVPSFKFKRCKPCNLLNKILNERNRTRPAGLVNTPPKYKGHAYLNTPEKKKRLERASEEIERVKKANQRLRNRLNEVLKKDGVRINKSLSEDISNILNSPEAQNKLTDIQKMFIEQQVKASEQDDSRGMRWHPAMLRLAISIRSASPAAYEELSGMLKLPSERQLFNYTHCIEAKDGVNCLIIEDLAEQLNKSNPKSYQRLHVLSFDEMYIRKKLVFMKSTGDLVGYVKLDELDEELRSLENIMEDKAVGMKTVMKARPPIAEKILCYLVNGVANAIKSVVACYSVHNISKETLYFNTWEVIGELELRGLNVIAVACDGASVNHAFFQMHVPFENTNSGVVFATLNLFANRPLFFINDPAHLLKTARNNLYYSGKKNLKSKKAGYIRLLSKNGQKLQWETITQIFEAQSSSTLKTTWKLNKEDVYLNSFSMMKVSLAAHVLSKSVATYIRLNEELHCEELATFCEVMNNFFDMVNGAHSFHGRRTRNPNLEPYRSVDDDRFQKLLEILKYFEDWKDEVAAARLPASEAAKRFISIETFRGIERTIRGFIGAVKFTLLGASEESPEPFINARPFSSDDLEKYFSKLRGMFGSNRHPDLQQAKAATIKMHARSTLAFHGRKKGNVGVGDSPSLQDITRPKSRKVRRTL